MATQGEETVYESNLDSMSKEVLVAMVKAYRMKEKRWKEEKLGIKPEDSIKVVEIPNTDSPSKDSVQKRESSAGGKIKIKIEDKEKEKEKSDFLPMTARLVGNSSAQTTKAKKLEKASKEVGHEFLETCYKEKIPPLGSQIAIPNEKPPLALEASNGESKSAQLQKFIEKRQEEKDKQEDKKGERKSSEGHLTPEAPLTPHTARSHTFQHFSLTKQTIDQYKELFQKETAKIKKAASDELAARVDPDKNTILINSDEVQAESPAFHRHMQTSVSEADRFFEELRKFSDLGDHAGVMAYRAAHAMGELSVELFRLKNFMGEFGDSFLATSINRFAEVFSQVQTLNSELAADLMKTVVVPVRRYVEEQSSNIQRLSREQKKKSESFEGSLTKHMKKVQETDVELDEELNTAREQMYDAMLAYVSTLNDIEVSGKLNLVASLTGFNYFLAEHSLVLSTLLEPSFPFLKAFGSYVTKGKNIVSHRLPKLTAKVAPVTDSKAKIISTYQILLSSAQIMTISVTSMTFLILTQRRGYLYWANKLQKGKPTNWKRTYFTIDPGTLTQVSYEDGTVRASSLSHLRPGQISKKLYPLLTSSVKPRKDVDRALVFEITSMVADSDAPDKMHPETLLLQAETPYLFHAWFTAISSGIMDSLAGQTAPETTNKKAQTRVKVPPAVLDRLAEINPRCADCNQDGPEWASINLGAMICIECSGVHRALGVDFSKIRSITLDQWDVASYKLMMALGNARVNSLLEASLRDDSEIPKPKPMSSRAERERFITAKYKDKKFIKPLRDDDSNPTRALFNLLRVGEEQSDESEEKETIVGALSLILHGADVNAKAPADPTPDAENTEGFTPLHLAVLSKRVLLAQLIVANGGSADALTPKGDTALHLAARHNDPEIVALLVSAGSADTKIKNSDGKLAMDLAKKETMIEAAFGGSDPEVMGVISPRSERQVKRRGSTEVSEEEKPAKNSISTPERGSDRADRHKSATKMRNSVDVTPDRTLRGAGKSRPAADRRNASISGPSSSSPPTWDLNSSGQWSSPSTPNKPRPLSRPSTRDFVSAAKDAREKVKERNQTASEDEDERPSKSPEKEPSAPATSVVTPASPRSDKLGHVRVMKTDMTAKAGVPFTIRTGAVLGDDGAPIVGSLDDYSIDIIGPQMEEGEVTSVSNDGSFVINFTPTAAGQFYLQVYYKEKPIFSDYFLIEVQSS